MFVENDISVSRERLWKVCVLHFRQHIPVENKQMDSGKLRVLKTFFIISFLTFLIF
jgi:hypothetical protein